MATVIPKNSVWSAMSYTPPRGRCNYKTSLMSPACSCLRFMLHPVKAATSFECDGCQHHASYHSLENPEEDAVLKKWEAHETSNTTLKHAITGANRKRKRIAAKPPGEDQDLREIIELADVEDEVVDDQLEDQLQAELLEARTKRSRKRAA